MPKVDKDTMKKGLAELSGPGGLPMKSIKHNWKKPKSQKVKAESKPLNPWFCPCKDPKTKELCEKVMSPWDDMYYRLYGMCEKCFNKYNPTEEMKK